MTGFSASDREQRHAKIAHFSEQAVQRSLIGHGAGQERIAVLCQCNYQAVKPVGPLLSQMTSDPDLIDRRLI